MKWFQQGLHPVPATDIHPVTIHEDLLVRMLPYESLNLLHDLGKRQFAGPDVDVYVVHH